MQGRKDIQPKMMYQFNMDMLVPADNFYRKLSQALDLSFLYKSTTQYYGREGQASMDPDTGRSLWNLIVPNMESLQKQCKI